MGGGGDGLRGAWENGSRGVFVGGVEKGGLEGGWSSINSSEHVEGMLRMNCGTVGLWDNRVKIRGWM